MRQRRFPTPDYSLLSIPLLFLAALLFTLTGCAPAERVPDPADWPAKWEGRSLWSTPNAHIYAASGASAGEIDRLAARVKLEYAAELGQPTPPLLIIVHDDGESYPGNDYRALLRSTLRVDFTRNPEESSEGADSKAPKRPMSKRVDEAILEMFASAAATGTSLETLAGTMPLTCDKQALQAIGQTPGGLSDHVGGALVLPTRACLRTHVRQMVQGALKMYGIGPVAQALFAPILAIAESKAVDQIDRLRDVALFNQWLFEYADLPVERKREIAAAKLKELGGDAETTADSIVNAVK